MVQSNNITLIKIFLADKTDLEERIYRVTIKSIQASTCYGQKQNKNVTWFGLRRAAIQDGVNYSESLEELSCPTTASLLEDARPTKEGQ